MPYSATSITDFWRRWHITLSQWLRDYLYIPLGGNRKGKLRTLLNLTITMFLGGLWHGANWTFVVWGLLHGLGLAGHKYWVEKRTAWSIRVPPAVGWLTTYCFVCFCWIFFRAPDFSTALIILRKVMFIEDGGAPYFYLPLALLLPVVGFAHYLGHVMNTAVEESGFARTIVAPSFLRRLYGAACVRFATRAHSTGGYYMLLPLPSFFGGMIATMWLAVLYLFSSVTTSPFIYFQF